MQSPLRGHALRQPFYEAGAVVTKTLWLPSSTCSGWAAALSTDGAPFHKEAAATTASRKSQDVVLFQLHPLFRLGNHAVSGHRTQYFTRVAVEATASQKRKPKDFVIIQLHLLFRLRNHAVSGHPTQSLTRVAVEVTASQKPNDFVLIQLHLLLRLRNYPAGGHPTQSFTRTRWQQPLRRSLGTSCSSSSTCFCWGTTLWATRRALLSWLGDDNNQLRARTDRDTRRRQVSCPEGDPA